MQNMPTKDELVAFEQDIATCYNDAMIRAPIHLYDDNEEQLIEIFKEVQENDWVCCSWRSHYQCLLKGVPPEQLKRDILEGRSMSLCYRKQKIVSSAIVTGILPIALGIALDIKRKNLNDRVWVFVGDMTSETGSMWETTKYARNHALPIKFVVEDNGKSVCTNTRKVWNAQKLTFENVNDDYVIYYRYKLDKWPHAGSGTRIQF